MPTLNQHLSRAERNERFAEAITSLPTRFSDWEIIALFYSALHYADALLATRGIHPGSHDSRIASVKLFTGAWEDHQHLYRLSLAVRYNMVSPTPAEADALSDGEFRRFKDEILALLANGA